MKLATRLPAERSLRAADADRIARIREEIIAIGDEFRSSHPRIARNQDAIGLTIFIVAVAGVLIDAVLYVEGVIPWWVCIPVSAFWLSILHELEHDLIHLMYFRNRRWIHNTMLFGVYVLRPNTVNPWLRRHLHLHHHEMSGTDSDLEERVVTNGQPWSGHRLLYLLDQLVGIYTRPFRFGGVVKDYAEYQAQNPAGLPRLTSLTFLLYSPLAALYYIAWHLFIGLHAFQLFGGYIAPTPAYHALNVLAVVLLAPNALRNFCLVFVSSNMHYHGDVEEHNVFKQTQVWTAKRMWPFQAFCFNFGGTHAIHHFVVRDPFYIRQATAEDCRAVLRANGVRFNDFGTFRRANRWTISGAAVEP